METIENVMNGLKKTINHAMNGLKGIFNNVRDNVGQNEIKTFISFVGVAGGSIAIFLSLDGLEVYARLNYFGQVAVELLFTVGGLVLACCLLSFHGVLRGLSIVRHTYAGFGRGVGAFVVIMFGVWVRSLEEKCMAGILIWYYMAAIIWGVCGFLGPTYDFGLFAFCCTTWVYQSFLTAGRLDVYTWCFALLSGVVIGLWWGYCPLVTLDEEGERELRDRLLAE